MHIEPDQHIFIFKNKSYQQDMIFRLKLKLKEKHYTRSYTKKCFWLILYLWCTISFSSSVNEEAHKSICIIFQVADKPLFEEPEEDSIEEMFDEDAVRDVTEDAVRDVTEDAKEEEQNQGLLCPLIYD